MRETKFYCDVCRKEANHLRGIDLNTSKNPWELCEDCYKKLIKFLSKLQQKNEK